LTSLFQHPSRRRGWLPVLGSATLAATLAAGCGASSTSPPPASSSSAGSARSASFTQCLKKHGVTPPAGFGQGGGFGGGGGGGQGGGQPHARPTGGAASAFRNAMKACGATGFPGGGPAG
jgi:hypothetical protein